jgi:hypothetical protein
MPYTHFWHQYTQRHAGDGGSGLTLDPTAALMVAICLSLLLAWTFHQAGDRCDRCKHWPARCRCDRLAKRRR